VNTLKDDKKPEILYVDLPDARIAYQIYGSGEPIVMCTGYASHMDSWSPTLIQALQKNYSVIVFDYRGMGYSENRAPSFTISTLAEDLRLFLQAINIEKANLLGWSMGGFVAQMFALDHPEMVNKLVLYGTHAGGGTFVEPAPEVVSILSNPAADPMALLGTLFPDAWLSTHPEPWKWLPPATEQFNPATIGLEYAAVEAWVAPGGGSADRLARLQGPVLIICGEEDKIAPVKNSLQMKQAIGASALLVVIPESGHGVMYQLPDLFADHVSAFFATP